MRETKRKETREKPIVRLKRRTALILAFGLLIVSLGLLLPTPYVLADTTTCLTGQTTPRLNSSSIAGAGLISSVTRSDTDLFGSSNGQCAIDNTNRTIIRSLPSYSDLKANYFSNAKPNSSVQKIDLGNINATQANLTNLGASDTIYHIGGDLILTSTLSGSHAGMIFVDGNLTINSPTKGQVFAFSYPGSGLAFIVGGNINISQDITSADGVFVTGGTFCSGADTTGKCSFVRYANPLQINGSVVALNQPPSFVRSLQDNSVTPAETINYQPKFLVVMQNLLSTTMVSTSEVYNSSYAQPTNPLATSTPLPGATPTPIPTPPPPVPVVSLTASPNPVPNQGSTTLTWSSTNSATSCTASSSPNVWSGILTPSGSQTVSNLTASFYTFSLYCTNAGGNSSTYSIDVSVNPPTCGDGICNGTETGSSCPQDCTTGKCTQGTVTQAFGFTNGSKVSTSLSNGLPEIFHRDGSTNLINSACTNLASCTANNYPLGSFSGAADWVSSVTPADGNPFIVFTESNPTYNLDNIGVFKCYNSNCSGGGQLSANINPNPATSIGSVTNNNSPAPAVAIGSDGLPVIAFFAGPTSTAQGSLQFIQCLNPACTVRNNYTIDSGFNTGGFPSVVVPSDGLPFIVYSKPDPKSGLLTINTAKCLYSSCFSSKINANYYTNSYGDFSSVAIGSDGYPIISLRSSVTNQSCSTSCTSSGCGTRLVGPSCQGIPGCGGVSCSCSTNCSYSVASSYLSTIKCADAYCSGFTQATLDNSSSNLGAYNSIAIGTDSKPVIAYQDSTNHQLKVAKCAKSDCSGTPYITSYSPGQNWGYGNSLVVPSDGLPVVGFQDVNKNLQYLRCSN